MWCARTARSSKPFPIGLVPTNCGFDGGKLYVTDGGPPSDGEGPGLDGALWLVELDGVTGAPPFPGPAG